MELTFMSYLLKPVKSTMYGTSPPSCVKYLCFRFDIGVSGWLWFCVLKVKSSAKMLNCSSVCLDRIKY